MSLSSDNLSLTLNTIQRDLYRYVLSPGLVFGTVGNLFNLIIFVQPYLRTNPCSIYLLSYTIVSFLWLDFMAITSVLNIGFSIDIGAHLLVACRIRTYIAYVIINLIPDFLILAAFDRTCVCSRRVTVRQYSSVKVAAYSICGVTLFWLIFNIPAWIYTSIAQLPSGQPICTPLPGNPFNDFIFIFFAITYGILPPIILVTLSCITLTKLIRFVKAVLPIDELSQYRPNEKERQLIIMLLSQVLVTVLCQTPSTIYQVYAVVTRYHEKSYERQIIDFFVYNLFVLILYLPPCLSFYIYFITTKTFRNEFRNVMQKIVHLGR